MTAAPCWSQLHFTAGSFHRWAGVAKETAYGARRREAAAVNRLTSRFAKVFDPVSVSVRDRRKASS